MVRASRFEFQPAYMFLLSYSAMLVKMHSASKRIETTTTNYIIQYAGPMAPVPVDSPGGDTIIPPHGSGGCCDAIHLNDAGTGLASGMAASCDHSGMLRNGPNSDQYGSICPHICSPFCLPASPSTAPLTPFLCAPSAFSPGLGSLSPGLGEASLRDSEKPLSGTQTLGLPTP